MNFTTENFISADGTRHNVSFISRPNQQKGDLKSFSEGGASLSNENLGENRQLTSEVFVTINVIN